MSGWNFWIWPVGCGVVVTAFLFLRIAINNRKSKKQNAVISGAQISLGSNSPNIIGSENKIEGRHD